MTAILTKYLGPTNHRGSRVKATLPSGKSLTLGWDCALNSEENHELAAKAIASKQWPERPLKGIKTAWLPKGYVHLVEWQ